MAFFSRPNLDNEQFKQLSGTTLTLSGTTQITEQGGFQLPDGNGGYIPVVTCGAVNQTVLTYIQSGSTCCLALLPPSSGSSTGKYTCDSPTTCSVGGIPAGTPIYNLGIDEILEMILVPTIEPAIVSSPYSVFTLSPVTGTTMEVCQPVNFTGIINTFNRGVVSPAYGDNDGYRVGTKTCNVFSSIWGGTTYCTSGSSSISFGAQKIGLGSNPMSGYVCYNAGCCVYKSDGITESSTYMQCLVGVTNGTCPSAVITRTIQGIYPYFYGVSDSIPPVGTSSGASLLLTTAMCKVVQPSSGSIAVNFNATNKYLWLAIPNGTSKVKWAGSNSVTNTESIPGGLFPAKINQSVNSPTSGYWSGVTYNFYISNYKTSTYEGITPYTITFTNS